MGTLQLSVIPSLSRQGALRAQVDLGGLTPEDVQVQSVTGRVDISEHLHDISTVDMVFVPATDSSGVVDTGFRYEAHLPLTQSGPVGYTVRVLPRHELLASPAELGLVTTA